MYNNKNNPCDMRLVRLLRSMDADNAAGVRDYEKEKRELSI